MVTAGGAPRDVARENAESELVPDSKVLNSTWTQPATSKSCYDRWMKKLDNGDYSGVQLPPGSYIPLRGNTTVENVRAAETYKDQCVEAVGLGKALDRPRYAHLTEKAKTFDSELLGDTERMMKELDEADFISLQNSDSGIL